MTFAKNTVRIEEIKSIIRGSGEKGIWMSEIARKMRPPVSFSTISYYINGKKQYGKFCGGHLKKFVKTSGDIGMSKLIKWKADEK